MKDDSYDSYNEMIELGVRQTLQGTAATEQEIEDTIETVKGLVPDELSPLQAYAAAVTMKAIVATAAISSDLQDHVEKVLNTDKYKNQVAKEIIQTLETGIEVGVNRALEQTGEYRFKAKVTLEEKGDEMEEALQKWLK